MTIDKNIDISLDNFSIPINNTLKNVTLQMLILKWRY